MHCRENYSKYSSIICPVWLNDWSFVYELTSGCGYESCCCHLNFSYRTFFEPGVAWYWGSYRPEGVDSLWNAYVTCIKYNDIIITYFSINKFGNNFRINRFTLNFMFCLKGNILQLYCKYIGIDVLPKCTDIWHDHFIFSSNIIYAIFSCLKKYHESLYIFRYCSSVFRKYSEPVKCLRWGSMLYVWLEVETQNYTRVGVSI